jgi:hypothetical protein|nr:hypothetical protein [uncultured Flavobacterium sp.]
MFWEVFVGVGADVNWVLSEEQLMQKSAKTYNSIDFEMVAEIGSV